MTTFLLVHGAWHGSWAWNRLNPLLEAVGAHTATPELSLDPDRGLGDHSDEVTVAIDALPAEGELVLVGHSYAGLVVRQAADRRRERVSRIVLVDGWAGGDGQSLVDLAPSWFGPAVEGATENGLVPPPGPDAFGVTDPDDQAWLWQRLRPHPLASFIEPTRLTGAVDDIPGLAIVTDQRQMPFAEMARRIAYLTIEVEGPHDVMLTHPERLAERLR